MAFLRIGSRGSQLALWQANFVSGELRRKGHTVEIEVIKTTGDKITEVALSQVGTKGMFTKEIEEALAAGQIDLAVHSLKDVPTELAAQYQLAAILYREDPRDVLVSCKLDSLAVLPRNARVGTSSLRREAQLRALRSDLNISPLRGNVDTRLRKLEAGEYDAIILAASGLNRLGRTELVRQHIDPTIMCPAAGQGALAIETRAGDRKTAEALAFMDHPQSRAAVECERAALNGLGGGCQVPIGAYAQCQEDKIDLLVVVAHPNGSCVIREQRSGYNATALGAEVAKALLAKGAQDILKDIYESGAVARQKP